MLVGLDFETRRFSPGDMAPRPICLSYADAGGSGVAVGMEDMRATLMHYLDPKWDGDGGDGYVIVGHNIAYDMCVAVKHFPELKASIISMYERSRIICTKLLWQLYDLAYIGYLRGPYNLAALVEQEFHVVLDKMTWRLSYEMLEDVPKNAWPEGALKYARDDAFYTRALAQQIPSWSPDIAAQSRASFALTWSSNCGLRADANKVHAFVNATGAKLIEQFADVARFYDDKGVKKTARILDYCRAEHIELPRSEKDNAKLDFDTLYSTHDETLIKLADYNRLKSSFARDEPMLLKAVDAPLHTRYGLAETGRTTSSGPNLQNMPRKGAVRSCFVPKQGAFVVLDYSGLELHTFAQACIDLGYGSRMAEVLNSGLDAHTNLAAHILGICYKECQRRVSEDDSSAKNARQLAKVAHFGFLGLMGPRSLTNWARKAYGVTLTVDEATSLRAQLLSAYPEIARFFALAKAATYETGEADVTLPRSGRRRAKCNAPAYCNTFFQGAGADVMKRAMWLCVIACLEESSPLYGCEIPLQVHDEIVVDCRPEIAQAVGEAAEQLMKRAGSFFLVDCSPRVEWSVMLGGYGK